MIMTILIDSDSESIRMVMVTIKSTIEDKIMNIEDQTAQDLIDNEGEPTLYYLLNDKQKELYGRITMELDEFGDFSLEEVKEVYAALIQDPEVIDFTLKAVSKSNDGCDWDV
jgi:hypothetical protein